MKIKLIKKLCTIAFDKLQQMNGIERKILVEDDSNWEITAMIMNFIYNYDN